MYSILRAKQATAKGNQNVIKDWRWDYFEYFQPLCLEQKLKSADGNEAKQQKVTRLMCLILNYLV